MNWICPHCGMRQISTDSNYDSFQATASIGEFREISSKGRALLITGNALCCANPECTRATVQIRLNSSFRDTAGRMNEGRQFLSEQLYPKPHGKPFPNFVPEFLLEDYREAWSIAALSPKASATLARRCLQSMIRDFCDIHERTLFLEIGVLEQRLNDDALPKGVEAETVEAMRALKDLGNIGAHMTEVEGKIVDVEPEEAETLLGLIEMLFSDWYIARAKRQERLAAIQKIAHDKKNPPASDRPAEDVEPIQPSA